MKRQNRVAFFNILSTLLLRGMSIFTMPLFTRLLGTSNYGISKVYATWTSAFAIVFTLQTQSTLVNARVEYPLEEQNKYQSSVMALSLGTFLACSAVVLIFLRPISQAMKLSEILVVLMLVQSFGTFCVNFLNTKFIYEFKAGWNMLLSVGISLVTLGLSLALILPMPKELNYYGRIGATAATYATFGIPVCLTVLFQGKTLIRPDYWKFCLTLAVPAVFYNLSDLVLGHSDSVMIQQMLGESQVGVYGAAISFGGVLFTIFQALNNSWSPFFFEDMKQGDREKIHTKAKNFLELFTVLSLGFILLTPEVYRMFVAEDFWEGTGLIPIFVGGYFFNFLCTFPVNFDYYHKQTKVVAAVTIFCTLVNLGLNYILIHAMGMAGAAVATMSSHGLQLGLHYGYSRLILGKGDYPFKLGMWAKYAVVYALGAALVYGTSDWALLRWGLGAALGIWELLRVRERKVLI